MQRAAIAALTLAAAAGIPPATAQDQQETATLTATISQSAVADTNYNLDDPSPGTSYYGDTRLTLDFLRETRTQSFGLGLDTGLRSLWEAEEPFEFVLASPSRAYLAYSQEGADTAFDANFRLRSRLVDSTDVFDDGGATPDDLNIADDDATELRADADIGFILGTTSPSTYEFRVLATDFSYSEDTNRGNLVPRSSVEGQLIWTVAITPVFSTALFGSYYYYTADDEPQNEVRVAEAEAGLVYEPSETLRIRGGIGYADRDRTQVIDGSRQTFQHDTGPTVRGDFRYIRPEFTLLGDGRLTAAAPQTRLSGTLRGVYALPRGEITGRVFQRYGGGQGGNDSRITGAGIGLSHDLNTVSRLEFDASYAVQVDEDDPDEPNIDRTDLTASYIYDVTQTVSAELGYGYRHRIEDPEDANSHRLFVVIGRTFETGL
jgi:hypothetical protein